MALTTEQINILQEMSTDFDLYFNNISSNKAPGLNELEKSKLLTQAQELEVLEYYSGRNATYKSFEETEEIRRYLSSLLVDTIIVSDEYEATKSKRDAAVSGTVVWNNISKQYIFTPTVTSETTSFIYPNYGKDSNNNYWISAPNTNAVTLLTTAGKNYTLPSNTWFITYEACTVEGRSREVLVVPITQDDYYQTMENPFKQPTNSRYYRMDKADNKLSIISAKDDDQILSYHLKYIKRPDPIILVDLDDNYEDATIEGKYKQTAYTLGLALRTKIVQRAAMLAKTLYVS